LGTKVEPSGRENGGCFTLILFPVVDNPVKFQDGANLIEDLLVEENLAARLLDIFGKYERTTCGNFQTHNVLI